MTLGHNPIVVVGSDQKQRKTVSHPQNNNDFNLDEIHEIGTNTDDDAHSPAKEAFRIGGQAHMNSNSSKNMNSIEHDHQDYNKFKLMNLSNLVKEQGTQCRIIT